MTGIGLFPRRCSSTRPYIAASSRSKHCRPRLDWLLAQVFRGKDRPNYSQVEYGNVILRMLNTRALLHHFGRGRSTKLFWASFFSFAAMNPVSFSTSCLFRAPRPRRRSTRQVDVNLHARKRHVGAKGGAVTSGPRRSPRRWPSRRSTAVIGASSTATALRSGRRTVGRLRRHALPGADVAYRPQHL